jgi:hypothetical protein
MTQNLAAAGVVTSEQVTREVLMLSDLSALTPPLLVAVAFLIAAGAFIRHEVRRGKNRSDDEGSADSRIDSSRESGINDLGSGSAQRSFGDTTGDRDRDPDS